MRSMLCQFALLAIAATLLPAQNSPLVIAERTEHFVIRCRPGSPAEASVDRTASLVEQDLALILRELGMAEFEHTIELFLYDDEHELQVITGGQASGYSVPLASHAPHDNDQTRVHELVHVVAEKFAERGPERRNLFVAEGLANAVLRFVHGVHVDAVAAFHRRRGDLPPLAEMLGAEDFYSWLRLHPHFDGYDVAGSWMRFLLDTRGAEPVRRYYGGVAAADALGKPIDELEREWHAHLDRVVLRPGTEALLRRRLGRTAAERNPAEATLAEALGNASIVWRWASEADLPPGGPGKLMGAGEERTLLLDGVANNGDWCIATFREGLGDAIVRATIEPLDGCFGIRVDLGDDCQALLLRDQGAFVYTMQGGVGHADLPMPKGPVQLVLRRNGAHATVWIDGKLAVEGEVGTAAARFGVGCVGGRALARAVATSSL
ncbi:MAG: hypothetical protein ABIP94_11390 [Planctomycetota bacterium]